MQQHEKIITKDFGTPGLDKLEGYRQKNGYHALKKVLEEMTPAGVIDEMKKAALRGRGGAGFPAGLKWSFVPMNIPKPRYLCVNADEGEPGTFKDKLIMETAPHMLIEGIAIACYALQIHHAYVYIRGEFIASLKSVQAAVDEAYDAGILGKNVMGKDFVLDVTVHQGAGAYICGEETALIESLEGKKGQPRIKPPFPAVAGLFGCPTVVNNVETLAFVPHIIEKGTEWWLKLGSEKNPGNRLFSVSGHVKNAGVFELSMGTTLREIIFEHAGGPRDGRKVKAIIPGGVSASVLTPDDLDTKADFDSLAAKGSMGGSGGVIVMDDSTCMVRAAERIARFFAHESCGQCTPCREGTDWVYKILQRIERGQAVQADIEKVLTVCKNMCGVTICVLADGCAAPIMSIIKKWRQEFDDHVNLKRCPMRPTA